MSKTYQVRIGDEKYEVTRSGNGKLALDGKEVEWDVAETHGGNYSILFRGSVYEVSPLEEDLPSDNPGRDILVNGRVYRVLVEDERSRLLNTVLAESKSGVSEITLRAPMPGLITKIEVREGERISEGQGLIILEAMKMENEIRSSVHATVTTVHVSVRQGVEKGTALLTLSIS